MPATDGTFSANISFTPSITTVLLHIVPSGLRPSPHDRNSACRRFSKPSRNTVQLHTIMPTACPQSLPPQASYLRTLKPVPLISLTAKRASMSATHLHASPAPRTASARKIKPTSLTCSRCQGHLVADVYIDTVDAGGHVWIRALRCVRCGSLEGTGRAGSGLHSPGRKSGWTRQGTPQKEIDDEMTALGT